MTKIKKPSINGLNEAKEEFDKLRKKKPTDELINIIAEIGEEELDQEAPLQKIAKTNNDFNSEMMI